MAVIHHDIYRRKCRIFDRFWFSCTIFDGHLKIQSIKTPRSGSVCTGYRAILKISESFNSLKSHAKRRSDILINTANSLLFCRSSGCVPLSTNTDRLIWSALPAPER